MSTYTIDTAKAFERLVSAGMDGAQAKAVVETFSQSQDQIATKSDLDALKLHFRFWLLLPQIATAGLLFTLLQWFPPG